ncbi:MAG: UDP-N-acetylglucosamine 1-carboxyvinyltransferase [Clostridia bacterium]|nr:UDP-N-acetylglucosamine 1-carboxyvinyltransferase [Clostridia bacterium]
MADFIVNGRSVLCGEVDIHGAKNSALPILAATLLCNSKCTLYNCPELSDVDAALKILKYLGCKIHRQCDAVEIDPSNAFGKEIPDFLMREMRSSIVFLGAILAKCSNALLSYPGGCELGPRPIDIHLNSFKKMGVEVDERFGSINCQCCNGLCGATINLPFPSVGATENILLAAVTAKGTTKIHNAAREPEIIDLAAFLNSCGGKIQGAGDSVITVEGVAHLHGCEHSIIPDRIEAATYMAAAAATGGKILLKNVIPDHIEPVFYAFREAGCDMEIGENTIKLTAPKRLSRIKLIRTLVYPGFPTDAQAPIMTMCTVARGTSIFIETIFQNRYKHANELLRFGANIKVEGRVAVVEGTERLYATEAKATDLRGGAALVIAAMCAEGVSRITDIYHIDRGYQSMEKVLTKLGVDIKREV